jgi:hypothetical protein
LYVNNREYMTDTLEEIIGVEKETPATSGPTGPAEKPEDEEIRKKSEQLANVRKAIDQANDELRKLRAAKKTVKLQPQDGEEILPKIDLDDPSAKAWDQRIKDTVNPVQAELDSEKREIRTFALQQFLADKPALSKDPAKIKELVELYEKIRTATERTTEGVLLDLQRAYAALNADELIAAARGKRIDKAQADSTFSDMAVSHGASSYQSPKKPNYSAQLTDEDKLQLSKWGMSPEEWATEKEKYSG